MKYSFIIATYNRIDELRELFASFHQLSFPSDQYEVVVVDDGSTDGTQSYLNSLSTPYTLIYFRQENQGPGAARNQGMQLAKGEYFIFIDSDVILPSDYLDEVNRELTRSDWDAFGGPDDAHPSFPPLLKAINYSMTSFIGTGGTRGKKSSVTKFYPRSFNMGIRRQVFEKIGGMNQLRHGQDMDYSARIYEAGFKVGLIENAVVYHKRRTSFWRFFKQIFNWGVTRINLAKSHEGMLKWVHLLPAMILLFALIAVFLCLILSFCIPVLGIMVIASGVLLWVFIESIIKNRSILVGLLSMITICIQIGAYGLGTWSGLIQHWRGKKVATGITRNYYK